MLPPEKFEGVDEEAEAATIAAAAGSGAAGAAATAGDAAGGKAAVEQAPKAPAVNYDKELRKLIGAMEMNFNSGVANLKKVPGTDHRLKCPGRRGLAAPCSKDALQH